MACVDVILAAKNFISHIAMIYDTTLAPMLAGVWCIPTGRVYWPTALEIGRMARSCYKERARGYPLADENPASVATIYISAAPARLPTPWHYSQWSYP
jgi:hypothetical protein